MTSIMDQVICSLCNIKTDELQWNEHSVSTNRLELVKIIEVKLH